jgi:hypothetical protein
MAISDTTFSEYDGIAAPAVSAAGKGRIYFDSTSNTYKVSQNGATYANLTASVLHWGNGGITTTTTTRFLTPGFAPSNAQTTAIQFRVPFSGTIRNLRVHFNAAGTGANLIVFTVRVNGVASALSVSMAANATDGSDLANIVTVAAGDLVDVRVTKAVAIGGTPGDIMATLEIAAG